MKIKIFSLLIIFLIFEVVSVYAAESSSGAKASTTTPITNIPLVDLTKLGESIKIEDGKVVSADITESNLQGGRYVMGGKEFYAPKGSRIQLNQGENIIKVSLTDKSQVKLEPKINNTQEDKIIRYFVPQGSQAALPNGMSFSGALSHNGKNWFVAPRDEPIIEKVKIKNIYGQLKNLNENVNVYFTEGKFEGNYVYFGRDKLIAGSANTLDGNPIQFLEGNRYIKIEKNMHTAIQPLANSKITVQNGKVASVGGVIMDQDYSTYATDNRLKWKLLYRKGLGIKGFTPSEFAGTAPAEIEFIPFKDDGKPVSKYNAKIVWDKSGGHKMVYMTNDEMRLSINKPTGNVPVTPVPPANIPESQMQALPDYSQYMGRETTARTQNFYVISQNGNARAYAQALEYNRRKNAIDWTGKPLPNWRTPVTVQIGERDQYGNPYPAGYGGGATNILYSSGIFGGGSVEGYTMSIFGNSEHLLYSTIPHETQHMVNAETFKQQTPRWIDEGMATSTEAISAKKRLSQMLDAFLRTGRGIPFNSMLAMKEYPQDVMPFYAQGYSAAEYLISLGGGGIEGKRKLYQAVGYANQYGWQNALSRYYGFQNLGDFQNKWLSSLTAKIIAIFAKIMDFYFRGYLIR